MPPVAALFALIALAAFEARPPWSGAAVGLLAVLAMALSLAPGQPVRRGWRPVALIWAVVVLAGLIATHPGASRIAVTGLAVCTALAVVSRGRRRG